jgi:predicted O-methyltransferase YrrM
MSGTDATAKRERKVVFLPNEPPEPMLVAQPERFDAVLSSQALLAWRERVYLYASVFAFAPERCLEIGVFEGHSSRIIHAALSDLDHGRLFAVDPKPRVSFDWQADLGDRATLVTGASPDDLARIAATAGGPFDFVFLDGNHEYENVLADFRGIVGVTRPGAMILVHDAYYEPSRQAMDDAVAEGLPLTDCGIVCTTKSDGTQEGRDVSYCGFRQFFRAWG